MGEVYRARDMRLKRDVAIKLLPDGLADDPDRLARFQREAELLATLNHPNIASIYGFEETASINGIVLELVEGPTLADRIAGGAIPIDEALAISRQVADALESAHDNGVVHRDLKPANIKMTPGGQVKVLDFGLAKAMESAASPAASASISPTMVSPATQAGLILGTAAYMSPSRREASPSISGRISGRSAACCSRCWPVDRRSASASRHHHFQLRHLARRAALHHGEAGIRRRPAERDAELV